MMNVLLLTLLAFGAIDHPTVDDLPPHMQETLMDARNAYQNAPADSATALAELAMVYQANNFLLPARQAFEQAARLSPKDARWRYYLGLLAMREGRFADAQQEFGASLTLNSDYVPARVRLAEAQLEHGQVTEARAALVALTRDHPAVAAGHAMLGRVALGEGDFDVAISHLTRALELQPSANALATPLAMAYRGTGDREQAALWLGRRGGREVALGDPLNQRMMSRSRSFNYFLSLGIEAADAGNLEQGIQYLNTARDIAPDNPNVWVTLARMYEAQGDLLAAVEAADQALSADPGYALALEQRGVLAEMRGDTQAAKSWYEQALAIDDSRFDARLLLANELMRSGNYAGAATHLETLREARPGDSLVTLRLAVSYAESQRCSNAARLADQQLRSQPTLTLGLVFVRVVATCDTGVEEHTALALNTARQLYAREPDVDITTSLAMIEFAAGDHQAAVEYQQQALFAAVRDGMAEARLDELKQMLRQLEAGKLSRRPWPEKHPVAVPAPARPGDR